MAKETTTEKYIKKAVKAVKDELVSTDITGCEFAGVKFTEEATTAMTSIADALETNAEACRINAEALKELSKTLSVSGVKIDTLMKIGG